VRRRLLQHGLPIVAGLVLAALIAAAGFGMMSALRGPAHGNLVAAKVLARFERLRRTRADETVLQHQVAATCTSTGRRDETLRLGTRTLRVSLTKYGHVRLAGRVRRSRSDAAEANLAACPDIVRDELARRLLSSDGVALVSAAWNGRPAFRLRISRGRELVQLVVAQQTLKPLGVVFTSRHLRGRSSLVTDTPTFLELAQRGLATARQSWWNSRLGWYDDQLAPDNARMPLAYLWSSFPLFEAYAAVAEARPTAANLARVASFANGADRYWNAELRPVPGYAYYPGMSGPRLRTYFDDNGWWAIAFTDAFRATGNRRYLADAARALRLIVSSGWNPNGGGTWWDTGRGHTTSEPLAAAAYTAIVLYETTHRRPYLDESERLVAWANTHLRDKRTGLFGRNTSDATAMDYVQGMMIGAMLELCRATGARHYCTEAERVGTASLKAFPSPLHWSSTADALYLRFLLALHRFDGRSRWRTVVLQNALDARDNAASGGGLYLRSWTGDTVPGGRLRTHAGTVSLFAWLAAR
jgi:hypothetical protein